MAKLLFRRNLRPRKNVSILEYLTVKWPVKLENFLMYIWRISLIFTRWFPVALVHLAQFLKQLWTYFGIKNHLRWYFLWILYISFLSKATLDYNTFLVNHAETFLLSKSFFIIAKCRNLFFLLTFQPIMVSEGWGLVVGELPAGWDLHGADTGAAGRLLPRSGQRKSVGPVWPSLSKHQN